MGIDIESVKLNNGNQIVPQVGEQFEMASNKVFMIPWGHIKLLIDKCHDSLEKINFYVDKIIENNWSRAVLLNFLDTDLFERHGQAITNFKYTLPKGNGDLAQEITKDLYNFDFIAIREGYNEKELKDALMDNVQNFLMELGTGTEHGNVNQWEYRVTDSCAGGAYFCFFGEAVCGGEIGMAREMKDSGIEWIGEMIQ